MHGGFGGTSGAHAVGGPLLERLIFPGGMLQHDYSIGKKWPQWYEGCNHRH